MDYFTLVDGHRYRVQRGAGVPPSTLRVQRLDEAEPEGEVGIATEAGAAGDARVGSPVEDSVQVPVDIAPPGEHPVRSVLLGPRSIRVLPRRDPAGDGRWTLEVEGRRYEAQVHDRGQDAVRRARRASGAAEGLSALRAPMPGMVMRVEVAVGDRVEPGQGLVIVEAMKMENELKAGAAARVSAIHAEAGTAVEKDAVLIEFEALEDDA